MALAIIAFAAPSMQAQGAVSVQFQTPLPLVSAASPSGPFGVALDKAGDLFITDFTNSRVLEAPAGCVSTACQMIVPTSGLNNPTAVAVDGTGDVFIADYDNNRVVEVPWNGTAFGTQVTLPSTGQNLPTGLAVDAAGDLYIANNDYTHTTPSRVIELPWNGSSYGSPVTIVNWLSAPSGLAIDGSGDLFVTDVSANEVVELPAGCSSSTCQIVVSSGVSTNDPGVTTDVAGDVFIAYFGGNEVLEVPHGCSSAACQIHVGYGLNDPAGVAVDGTGNIFIADYANNQVEKVNQNSLRIGAVSIGSSAGVTAEFTFNSAVTLNSTTPYSVLTQGATGLDFTDAGSSTCTGTSYSAGQSCTVKVNFSPARAGMVTGAVVLTDPNGNAVATAYLSGIGLGPQITFQPGTQTSLGGGLVSTSGVALDRKGNIYVADSVNRTVDELVAPAYTTVVPLGGSFTFSNPVSVALDGAGNVFVADKGSASIDEILAPAYTTVNALGSGFNSPSGVAVDGGGNVYVADSGNNAVKEIPEAGSYTQVITLASSFSGPSGAAVDGSGNVFVADTHNNAVKEILAVNGSIPASPTINTLASGFSAPGDVTLDGAGNLYVADTGNDAVKELTAASGYATITSLATNLVQPSSAALDSNGNVYVGSSADNQVVKLDYADPPSLVFSSSVGTASSPQTVTVINNGNAGLTFASPASGYNPSVSSGFMLEANESNGFPCPILSPSLSAATLAPGASCVDQLIFNPSAGGTISGSMVITDNNLNLNGSTQTILLSGTSVAITFAPTSLTSAQVGTSYSQTINASGGTAPYKFQLTAGTLPAGITLDSSGLLSGTPSASGTFNFIVTATDASTVSGNQAYSLTVSAPNITVTPASLPNAQANAAYSQALTASGGTAPYVFKLTAGSLPAGLTLSGAGVLSGTPTTNGSFNFTVTATDASTGSGAPFSCTITYTLAVTPPSITIAPSALPEGQVGTAYALVSLTANGGLGPYTYKVSAGSLPAGLSLSSAGVISGTPTSDGAFTLTVTATDTNGVTGSEAYSLTISQPTITVTPASLPSTQVNIAYSQTFTASGGTAPYTYKLTAGSLPAGLSLSSVGVLSGTPTTSGSFTFTVTATDNSSGTGAPFSGSDSCTLTVNAPNITISPSTLPTGQVGVAYSLLSLTASGGTAPYSYKVSAGSLPQGLTLSSAGGFSGTPTGGGTFTFTVTATDAGNYAGSQALSITVSAPSLTLAPGTLPPAQVQVGFSQSLTAGGGTAPYSLRMTGTLPAGLTFDASTGSISGTPTTGGSFPISVTVTDSSTGTGPYSSSFSYTLAVEPGTAILTFAGISPQTYGNPPFTVSATSASTGAISYSIVSGPATINPTTGLVTLTGAGEVAIEATQTASASYNGTIAQMPVNVARQNSATSITANLSSVTLGQNVTLTAAVAPTVMGAPTGTVAFYDGGTQIGTAVTLTNGTAQLVTSGLISGENTISAVYSGDSNFLGSSSSLSSPILVSSTDFSFANTGDTSQNIMPGGKATFSFALAPASTMYPGTVTFSVQGLPSGASSTLSPNTVSSTSGSQTITLTIQSSTNNSASAAQRPSSGRRYAPIALALFLPLLGLRKLRLKSRKLIRAVMLMILMLAGTFAIFPVSGCGAVSGVLGTSYSVSVTASSGTIQHTAFVNVTVK